MNSGNSSDCQSNTTARPYSVVLLLLLMLFLPSFTSKLLLRAFAATHSLQFIHTAVYTTLRSSPALCPARHMHTRTQICAVQPHYLSSHMYTHIYVHQCHSSSALCSQDTCMHARRGGGVVSRSARNASTSSTLRTRHKHSNKYTRVSIDPPTTTQYPTHHQKTNS